MRATAIQTSFARGELSPRLRGRVDLEVYFQGCEILENFTTRTQGAAIRRPGTRFVRKPKYDGSRYCRLIGVEIAHGLAYVLELGHEYIRFFRNHGWEVDGSGQIYEIASPYTEDDLDLVKYAVSAEGIYFAHPAWAPRRLFRNGPADWTLELLDFLDGPYLDANKTGTTLTPSAASGGSVTITASATAGINDGHGFLASDSGRVIRLKHVSGTAPNQTTKWGWGVITSVASTTSATVNVREAFGGTGATKDWRLGAWSETTGWPEVVTFFQERLVFANTDTEPDTFWMSKTGDLENFAPTDPDGAVKDDNAVSYTIADDRINEIFWLSAQEELVAGTGSAEFAIDGGAQGQPVSPTSIRVTRQTMHGSGALVGPQRVGHSLLYLQRAGRKVRELVYDLDTRGFISPDMTRLAEHVTRGGVYDMAYAQEPDSILWASRGDGLLIGMTYDVDEQMMAWHRHILGGRFEGGNPVVESLAVIPTPDESADELWMVVVRTIAGQTVRTIEYLEQPFQADPSLPATERMREAYFVDCGLSHRGEPAQVFGGLGHLEGETVQVMADGAVHPAVTVTDGQITLTRPASVVHVGLGYLSKLKTMPVEAGAAAGTAQAKRKRIHEVNLRILDSMGGLVGDREDNLDRIPTGVGLAGMGNAPPLFTGDHTLMFAGRYDRTGQVLVVQDLPLPLTLLSITMTLQTNE